MKFFHNSLFKLPRCEGISSPGAQSSISEKKHMAWKTAQLFPQVNQLNELSFTIYILKNV